jgi:hypothetical protein
MKKPSSEIKISNLIKYLIVCCQNGKGTISKSLCVFLIKSYVKFVQAFSFVVTY